MSPAETAKILAVIGSAYSGFELDRAKHTVWSQMLGDLPYSVADAAVRRHIMTSRFAPTIADLRESAAQIERGEEFTGAEAWGEFIAGVRRFGWNREQEALESFHPKTARVAKLIGWMDANMAENVSVLRGQFLRMFEQLQDRDQREAVLPHSGGQIESGRLRELATGVGKTMP